jgi:NADPH:quinone reductase-like Zn-dependent oxidoreductase
MEEAGSLPFVALTSWRGLVDTAGLSSSTSKRIFINGGSGTLLLVPTFFVLSLRAKINCVCVCGVGGIGVFSIQLLKSWGHYVVASCGERNVEKLTKLGCDQVLDYRSPQFQQFLDTPESVDVVLDTVGGAKSEARGLRVVKPGGHYLSLRGAPLLSNPAQLSLPPPPDLISFLPQVRWPP